MLRLRSRGSVKCGVRGGRVGGLVGGGRRAAVRARRPGGSSGAGNAMTTPVDRTRCDDSGKQLVTSDTNGDKRPDVLKLYKGGRPGGRRRADPGLQAGRPEQRRQDRHRLSLRRHRPARPSRSSISISTGASTCAPFIKAAARCAKRWTPTTTPGSTSPSTTKATAWFASNATPTTMAGSTNGSTTKRGKLDRIGYDSTGGGRVDRWERGPEVEAVAPADARRPGCPRRPGHPPPRRLAPCHPRRAAAGAPAPATPAR